MNGKAKGVAASNIRVPIPCRVKKTIPNLKQIRVPIPCSVKKTIDNLKQITGQNHSDEEIYARLKECFMDPDETALKLLLLGLDGFKIEKISEIHQDMLKFKREISQKLSNYMLDVMISSLEMFPSGIDHIYFQDTLRPLGFLRKKMCSLKEKLV